MTGVSWGQPPPHGPAEGGWGAVGMGAREVSTPGQDSYRVGRKVSVPLPRGPAPHQAPAHPSAPSGCKSHFRPCTEGPRSRFLTEREQRHSGSGIHRRATALSGSHGGTTAPRTRSSFSPSSFPLHRSPYIVTATGLLMGPGDTGRGYQKSRVSTADSAPVTGHSRKNPWVTGRGAPQTFPRT